MITGRSPFHSKPEGGDHLLSNGFVRTPTNYVGANIDRLLMNGQSNWHYSLINSYNRKDTKQKNSLRFI